MATRFMAFLAFVSFVVNLTMLGMVIAIFYILNSVWYGATQNQPVLVVSTQGK
jgi:hypothetical protein